MRQYTNVCKKYGTPNLYVRGYDGDRRFEEKIKYAPTLYVETVDKDTTYKSIHGENLKEKKFNSMFQAFGFRQTSFALQTPVYGMDNDVCAYMTETFTSDEYDKEQIRIFWLDIENKLVDKNGVNHGIQQYDTPYKITAISLYDSIDKQYHVFSCVDYSSKKDFPNEKILYYHCKDELDIARHFMQYWRTHFPDIVTGWNVNYDISYIINRLRKIVPVPELVNLLSPWKQIDERKFSDKRGSSHIEYTIKGISVVDYLEVYKKYKFSKQESYKLDYIAQIELGVGKIDYKAEGYKNLDDLLERNPQKYISYNITDVQRLLQIDEKNRFLDIVTGIAHYAKVNYDDVLSVIRCWDSITYAFLKERNIITSPKQKHEKKGKYKGAFVFPPTPGKYDWIATFDLASLYPSLIMTGNIGAETLVKPDMLPDKIKNLYGKSLISLILNNELPEDIERILQDNEMTMCANGMFYKNDKLSFFSEMSDDILKQRGMYKKRMLEDEKDLEVIKKEMLKRGLEI